MKPEINVTPLIDVLLVLLIIFMVISPMQPSKFEARIPGEPDPISDPPTPELSLVATINDDSSLSLNGSTNLGTIGDPTLLANKLVKVFAERTENYVINENAPATAPLPNRIQKTVFIKAPRRISYGNVIKVVDAIKGAGANPISLQIDDLE